MYGDAHAAAIVTWEQHYYENPRQFQAYNTTGPCPPLQMDMDPDTILRIASTCTQRMDPPFPDESHRIRDVHSGHFNESLAAYRLEVQTDSTNFQLLS